MKLNALILTSLLAVVAAPVLAALPAPPQPAENPTTEPKRVLGKALFWDEQLSSDNTVACGSCHRPAYGGGDPRRERGPGHDGKLGTEDDVFGSPGVVAMNARGAATKDAIFGHGFRVGTRAAPSNFGGLWAKTSFWDGRAGPTFRNPLTDAVEIVDGGALENQVLGPLMNDAEMARQSRSWPELQSSLKQARPLALARKLPPDLKPAAASTYPALFAKAFGDPEITPTRIAFAIAAYERTLIADQTPWDLDQAGIKPLTGDMASGRAFFDYHRCGQCHKPPLFSDDRFANIGLRPGFHDQGRRAITGDRRDDGRMKVPTLRNAGLRKSFGHTGELTTLDQIIDIYAAPKAPRDTLPDGTEYSAQMDQSARNGLKVFIRDALTDPRVAAESFPFDRPLLRSERAVGDKTVPGAPTGLHAGAAPGGGIRLNWRAPAGAVDDYVFLRNGDSVGRPTGPGFVDETAGPASFYLYSVVARSPAAKASPAAWTIAAGPFAWLWPLAGVGLFAAAGWRWRRRVVARLKPAA